MRSKRSAASCSWRGWSLPESLHSRPSGSAVDACTQPDTVARANAAVGYPIACGGHRHSASPSGEIADRRLLRSDVVPSSG